MPVEIPLMEYVTVLLLVLTPTTGKNLYPYFSELKLAAKLVDAVSLQSSIKIPSPIANGKLELPLPKDVSIKSSFSSSNVTKLPFTVIKSISNPLEFLVDIISKGPDNSVELVTILTDSIDPPNAIACNFIFKF